MYFIVLDCKFDHEKMKEIDKKILDELWSPEEKSLLTDVANRLEPLIQKYTEESGGAFVKLSTRRYEKSCDTVPILSDVTNLT